MKKTERQRTETRWPASSFWNSEHSEFHTSTQKRGSFTVSRCVPMERIISGRNSSGYASALISDLPAPLRWPQLKQKYSPALTSGQLRVINPLRTVGPQAEPGRTQADCELPVYIWPAQQQTGLKLCFRIRLRFALRWNNTNIIYSFPPRMVCSWTGATY